MVAELDRAQLLEREATRHSKKMNELIDLGDSDIQQFYHGATVFVTGASGFLGKQLIEKLLRSCQLKKLFLLLRPKKGKTIKERLEYVLSDPLYNILREKIPNFVDKLVPIEGNIADERLGISDKDWIMLTEEVDTVFHVAATVRFDEPIKIATLTNVRGTRECLNLARQCPNLKNFVHVSTAFTHATKDYIGKPLYEQFYPTPVPPAVMISMAETIDEERLNAITKDLIKKWPNTYTFTKAIAEEQVRMATDLPVCVIRPPVVICCYYDPFPGWMDISVISGPTGILTGSILGILHIFLVNKHCKLPLVPVDYVNNATIAAAWDAQRRRQNGQMEVPIYTVSNIKNSITWDFIGVRLRSLLQYSTPKAVWYCYVVETTNEYIYGFISMFVHYIPAYIMDAVGTLLGKKMPPGIPSYVGVYKKMDKLASIYKYFTLIDWSFQDDNVKKMISNMSDADKEIYNCDLNTIDFNEYVKIWGFVGIRKYIIKDGLVGSEKAYKKQINFFMYANIALLSFYVIVAFGILYNIWNFVSYLVM